MRTVVVLTLPAIGHVHPTLPIVAELVRRGDRVVYYCAEELRAKIEATGAELRPIPWDLSAVERAPRPRLCDLALAQARCAEAWMPDLLREIEALSPACLLVDFMCLWGRIAARTLGLPLVNLSSSFALGPGVLPPVPLLLAVDVGPSLAHARQVIALRRISARLSRRYRVAPLRTQFDVLSTEGDAVLVCTARAFQPDGDAYGDRFHFIGPSFAPRAGERPDALPPLDDRPLVYVSLGTVFNRDLGLFRRCVQAFADGRRQVLLSIGRHVDPAALGPLPPHVHARAYVPQLEVLSRAAAFVSHGGMNSVVESICHGVPLLVAPQAADQFAIAARVEAVGVGRKLSPLRRSPTALRAQVEALIGDPQVRVRCTQMKRAFEEAGGAQRAADVIQSLGARPAPHAMRASA